MKPKTAEKSDSTHPKRQNESTRERVLEAAFTLFCEHGFSDVSMLEIATRAQVSKRDLYGVTGQFVRNCTLRGRGLCIGGLKWS
jgi:AraC-like DNA-binding protein